MDAEASLYGYRWRSDTQKQDKLMPIGAPQDRLYLPTELLPHLYPLGSGAAPCPSGLKFTKKVLVKVGGFEESFRKELQLYKDQALLHKMYLKEQVYHLLSTSGQVQTADGIDSCTSAS
ncbi:hypothetical protein PKOR_16485 [Pontibacter korlensis]|uniref:Uncharacterized protein n=1 Tax=Pontibacter korlensis TaxID=400092 RepID=A0A0E3UYE0_9BACT|nr:hypothetical protein PKOR_16485 [Pontibacter korlensis]